VRAANRADPLPRYRYPMFVDEVKVHVRGGKGGNGVTAFARQPYEPRGRPEGGDGGDGGSVIARASADVATLVDYHHRPHRKAGGGRHGEGDLRRGAGGEDVVLAVPVGTVVKDAQGAVLADLVRAGDEVVLARGGRGGRGNAAFKTSARRAPKFHELGEPPEERWVALELKLVADVALVGFPNAGKSSLITRLSAARPKIADYPFTTLSPNLGVVQGGDVDFVVADVPGLVEGASQGRGLGHQFLRHVERAGVLVHVLDCASYEQRDPREDLQTVVAELAAYEAQVMAGGGWRPLLERPALVWLNKTDADPETAEIVRPDLEAAGFEVLAGSAVTGAGVDALRWRLVELVRAAREAQAVAAAEAGPTAGDRPVLRPARARTDFGVGRTDDGGFRVTGDRVERWVRMTDLGNDEAVRYLQGRLARAGVERALVAAGARRGDPVQIAGAVFDFEPEPADLPHDEFTGDLDLELEVEVEFELGDDGQDGQP
jgi:GTPase